MKLIQLVILSLLCCVQAVAQIKVESVFSFDENGEIVLGDEMLTPDSSRFWPVSEYVVGQSEPSFDKQFVRDWLKANPDSFNLEVKS